MEIQYQVRREEVQAERRFPGEWVWQPDSACSCEPIRVKKLKLILTCLTLSCRFSRLASSETLTLIGICILGMNNKNRWIFFGVVVSVLAAVSFTPLVIPYGVAEPYFLGLPRTLWAGLGISLSIYVLLVLAMLTSGDQG